MRDLFTKVDKKENYIARCCRTRGALNCVRSQLLNGFPSARKNRLCAKRMTLETQRKRAENAELKVEVEWISRLVSFLGARPEESPAQNCAGSPRDDAQSGEHLEKLYASQIGRPTQSARTSHALVEHCSGAQLGKLVW
jgi:hypothetical protein